MGIKHALDNGEKVEADMGYVGEPLHISTKDDFRSEEHQRSKDLARARQENINRYLKQFDVLYNTFRHDIQKHAVCFWAVAVITQLSIRFEEKLIWQVNYQGGETYNDPVIDLNYLLTILNVLGEDE
jgi:hypothetical protein